MKSKIREQQHHLDQAMIELAQSTYDLIYEDTLTELSRAQPWLRQSQQYELADHLVRKKMSQDLLKCLDEKMADNLLKVRLASCPEMYLQLERADDGYRMFLHSLSDHVNPVVSMQERDAPVLEYEKYGYGGSPVLSFGSKLSFFLEAADAAKVVQWIKMTEENKETDSEATKAKYPPYVEDELGVYMDSQSRALREFLSSPKG